MSIRPTIHKQVYTNLQNKKIVYRPNTRRHVSPEVSHVVDASYIIGKGIIMFTFIYTSLNWYMYRKDAEDND